MEGKFCNFELILLISYICKENFLLHSAYLPKSNIQIHNFFHEDNQN